MSTCACNVIANNSWIVVDRCSCNVPALCAGGTCWVHLEWMTRFEVHSRCNWKRVLHSRCTQHVPPVHNAGTLQEHLSTTIQLSLAITLQAHVDVTFQMWQKCYWWSHCRQMLRLHLKCEWNVSGRNIGRTLWQSLKCSQHVNTRFHRPLPPVLSVAVLCRCRGNASSSS